MGLKLYNTLTRTKQDFEPFDPKNVRMYVCGPTVYDFAHIGNARPLIVFDVLYRLLRHIYRPEHVTYVRNITDVDDKINARAAEEYPDLPLNDAIRKVTEKTAAQFHADVQALGCLTPTFEPRATEYVEKEGAPTDMIRLIAELVSSEHAYVREGHVLFHVPSMPDYGKLSHRSLDDMIAGARVEVAPYKRDPMDFVLWKPSRPGEPAWPSPWSNGRPGWHIECSAMAAALLGTTFDIHGGGIDLVFPHHENEIAQSRCAFGTPVMAKYWLHNGFLQVEGEKMSKSLGNFVTIRDVLRDWPGEVVRLAMLMTHYREPLNWTRHQLERADLELSAWTGDAAFANEAHAVVIERQQGKSVVELPKEFLDALSDDLNTPQAITVLRNFAKNKNRSPEDQRAIFLMLEILGLIRLKTLGALTRPIYGGALARHDVEKTLKLRAAIANDLADEKRAILADLERAGLEVKIAADGWLSVDATNTDRNRRAQWLAAARAAARKRKDFAEADRIRAELDAMGIALKDSKDPKTGELVTTWEVKR